MGREGAEAAWAVARAVPAQIGPLSDKSARELIAISACGGTLPPPVVDFVVEHCGGVPLHVDQMTKAFVESNLLFLGDDGAYELVRCGDLRPVVF